MKAKDIIKILPFDKEFQIDLLNNYDTLDGERKDYIVNTLWDAYYVFYKIKLQEKLSFALINVLDGEEEMDSDFYNSIRDEVEEEMKSEFHEKTNDVDLTAVRARLEAVINERKQEEL